MKRYIKPEFQIVELHAESVLCVSGNGFYEDTEADGGIEVLKSGRGQRWRDYEGR